MLVSFDLEFQPPGRRRRAAGDPFTLSFTMDEGQLRQAAGQGDAERAIFPGHTSLAAVPDSEPIWREVTAAESAGLGGPGTGGWAGGARRAPQAARALARDEGAHRGARLHRSP